MNSKKIIIGIIIVAIIVIAIKNNIQTDTYNEISYESAVVSDNTTENTTETEDNIIKIHITGEIMNPGIIELESGDRISDAIEKAGGTTSLADTSKVNLAYILSDGEKIYIPSINDEEDVEYLISSTESNSKININTATSEQLQTLNGVGESTAEAIITYRETNGKFSSIEDIKNVSGIGDSKYEKIKDNICVK